MTEKEFGKKAENANAFEAGFLTGMKLAEDIILDECEDDIPKKYKRQLARDIKANRHLQLESILKKKLRGS